MPEKTKLNEKIKKSLRKKLEKTESENRGDENEKNANDLPERESYYYDDSYGYEIYNPDKDDDDED